MHNKDNTVYNCLIEDILKDLKDSVEIAIRSGVKRENIILDPGIGFGKTYEQNLETMQKLEYLNILEYPILLGTSRKSMIGNTLKLPVEDRVEGTLATTVMGIIKGCDFVRVHDVLENKRACIMTDAIYRRNFK
jgi:dihydropteroate synthase